MSYYESEVFVPEDSCVPHTAKNVKNVKNVNMNTLTEMKRANNANFCTVKLRLNKKWKDHYLRSATISYYKTLSQSGARIIHAISGDELVGLVGTRDEDRYFKVKLTSYGESNNGNVFYLSPMEYENHQYCEVSQSTLDKWNLKNGI